MHEQQTPVAADGRPRTMLRGLMSYSSARPLVLPPDHFARAPRATGGPPPGAGRLEGVLPPDGRIARRLIADSGRMSIACRPGCSDGHPLDRLAAQGIMRLSGG